MTCLYYWQVQWQGSESLGDLQGSHVQIRFTLTLANLYAFTFTT